MDAGLAQHLGELVRAVRVPVVVPEHGEDRRLDALDGFDERGGLLRLAVKRQVARQQDEVGVSGGIGEDPDEPLVTRPARRGCLLLRQL